MTIYTCEEEFNKKYPGINLTEYFKFISDNSLPKRIKFETANHHILPNWAFPEFSKFKEFNWNCAILTHKNHLIAHFMLWDKWKVSNNASPVLLMCKDKERKSWSLEDINLYSNLYDSACKRHAESVSKRHTGKINSIETRNKISETRIKNKTNKGKMYCVLIETGKYVHIETEEYKKNKNILYLHANANKPAWNTGLTLEHLHKKVWCKLNGSSEFIHITTEEYKKNKHLYTHSSTGIVLEKGFLPAYNKITSKIERITTEEYNENLEKYTHPAKNLIWYNNNVSNKRIKLGETIPDGYIKGRLKTDISREKRETLTCLVCNMTGGAGNMKRYHFDNCKLFTRDS